jgi:two-component system, NarL family, nitrate/nitrite response regulator NarL
MSGVAPVLAPENTRRKVLFADDHHLLLDALEFMASPAFDVKAVDSLRGFEEAVDSFSPDLAVLDVHMPDGDGFEVARRILSRKPEIKLLFLSMHTEPKYVKEATDIGASGYVSKHAPAEELLLAMRTILNGGTYIGSGLETAASSTADAPLTERQIEVLRLISQGCSAKEIANRLNISVRTAEFHRAAIMDRLKLHSTALMTRYALEHGII